MIMAGKGKSRHMKGLNSPKYFDINRKERAYVTKPNPGRHMLESSITLKLLAEKLELGSKNTEAERIIKNGNILVNNKVVKEPKYPVGLNDTIEILNEKRYYRIGISRLGQVSITKLEKTDYDSKLYKVVGKYKTDSNKIMLRLHDGGIINGSNDVNVNDSLILDSKMKMAKVLKLQVGSECAVIDGVHVGASGKIKQLTKGTMHKTQSVLIEQNEGKAFETLVKNIMVTG